MSDTFLKVTGVVCGLMLAIVTLQAAFPPQPPVAPPPPVAVECIGEPIVVTYPYAGWSEPHECRVQCDDDRPRYILYTDGLATQCQTPPGCNDAGEDSGITCVPPLSTRT